MAKAKGEAPPPAVVAWRGPPALRETLAERWPEELRAGPYKDRRGWWGIVRDARTGLRSVVALREVVTFGVRGVERERLS